MTDINLWFVKYNVKGAGEKVAGPWLYEDAVEHAKDIRGYDGISRVRLELCKEAA